MKFSIESEIYPNIKILTSWPLNHKLLQLTIKIYQCDSSFSLRLINIKFAWDRSVLGDVSTRHQLQKTPSGHAPHLHLCKNLYCPQPGQLPPWKRLESLYLSLKANFPQSCHGVFFFVCVWDGQELNLSGFKIIFYSLYNFLLYSSFNQMYIAFQSKVFMWIRKRAFWASIFKYCNVNLH